MMMHSIGDSTFVPNTFLYLKKKFPKLHKWLIGTFGKDYDSFIVVKVYDDERTYVLFWTAEHVFHLSVQATELRGRDKGYLGLARTARMPNVGEEHCRGGDMHDGDYSEKTWNLIVRDILRHAILSTRPPIFTTNRKSKRTTKARVTMLVPTDEQISDTAMYDPEVSEVKSKKRRRRRKHGPMRGKFDRK
jgi:hypothetical protein